MEYSTDSILAFLRAKGWTGVLADCYYAVGTYDLYVSTDKGKMEYYSYSLPALWYKLVDLERQIA